MKTNKQNELIVRGHRPTRGFDTKTPPKGGSVVTKQLKNKKRPSKEE